jgi:hypothetical protein
MPGWILAVLGPAWTYVAAHWYIGAAAIAGALIVLAIADRRVA